MEVDMLKMLNHDNVLALHDSIYSTTNMVLIFPFVPSTLDDEIQQKEFDPKRAKSLIIMILNGIQHMHQKGIMHRDLKPENVLVDSNGVAKICDLGLSVQFKSGQYFMEESGTPIYNAPEIFLKDGYTENIDIWVCSSLI